MDTKKLIITITQKELKSGLIVTRRKLKGDEGLLHELYADAFREAEFALRVKEKSLFCKIFGL